MAACADGPFKGMSPDDVTGRMLADAVAPYMLCEADRLFVLDSGNWSPVVSDRSLRGPCQCMHSLLDASARSFDIVLKYERHVLPSSWGTCAQEWQLGRV